MAETEQYIEQVLSKYRDKIDFNATKKPDLSVVCITCKQDLAYLRDMLLSLPTGSEVILYYSEQGSGETQLQYKSEFGLEIKVVNDYYDEFSFSNALNKASSYATRSWILRLDTDERLLWNTYDSSQHPQFTEVLNDIPANIGGIYMHVASVLPPDNKYYAGRLYSAPIIRLYRNAGFKWVNRVHEQINPDIKAQGYEISPPMLNFPIIEHLGYYTQEPAKLLRNLKLLCRDIGEEKDFDEYKLFMLSRTMRDIANLQLFRVSPYVQD